MHTATARALAEIESLADPAVRRGLERYAIPSERALGVRVGDLRRLAKEFGRRQELAEALWNSGGFEARMLACFVAEPAKLTPAAMDRWCRDFDNWALVDAACYSLFDQTPHAFGRIRTWARRRGEFQRRAAFALIAGLAQHDRVTADEAFLGTLPLIEEAAADGRNFVKKGVSWALRGIGERSPKLHAEALALARRLAASASPAARWVGRDAARELERARVRNPRASATATRSPRRRATARS